MHEIYNTEEEQPTMQESSQEQQTEILFEFNRDALEQSFGNVYDVMGDSRYVDIVPQELSEVPTMFTEHLSDEQIEQCKGRALEGDPETGQPKYYEKFSPQEITPDRQELIQMQLRVAVLDGRITKEYAQNVLEAQRFLAVPGNKEKYSQDQLAHVEDFMAQVEKALGEPDNNIERLATHEKLVVALMQRLQERINNTSGNSFDDPVLQADIAELLAGIETMKIQTESIEASASFDQQINELGENVWNSMKSSVEAFKAFFNDALLEFDKDSLAHVIYHMGRSIGHTFNAVKEGAFAGVNSIKTLLEGIRLISAKVREYKHNSDSVYE